MQFLNNIKDDSILLVPSSIKDKILKYLDDNNKLLNIKFMSFSSLKEGLLFSYDNRAIDYVMKKHNKNYNIAEELINNMYYIDDVKSLVSKVAYLKKLKKELESQKLLIKDTLFINLLRSKKKLYVYGFDYLSKYDLYLLDSIKKYIEVEIIEKESHDFIHNVYELSTISEEIAFVAEKISKLIDEGIDINKIYISNYSDEYYFTIKRIFKMFNLPINLKNETALYDTYIGEFFINNITSNISDLLKTIEAKFDIKNNEQNSAVYNALISLINNYYWTNDMTSVKELLAEEMKKVTIKSMPLKNEIRVINVLDNYFKEDEYIFLIGFNEESVPKFKKDEDYIDDKIKPYYLDKSFEYNKEIKCSYLNAFKNIPNLTITYKIKDNFKSFIPSSLIDNKYLVCLKEKFAYSNYSSEYNKLTLASNIDNLIKFNEVREENGILLNSYDINYNSYDNKYTLIDSNKIRKKIDGNITFSYSNISTYYECPFKFYVSNILRIGEYEQTFDQFIGSLFHHCLEVCLEDETKNVSETYDEYVYLNLIEELNTYKNKFFIKSLKKEISFVIETIKMQYKNSSHNEVWNEKKIEIENQRKIKTKIKGFVDKILVLDNKALIIDYKTNSSLAIERDLFEFGLSLQLPIYLYLLKQLDSNMQVAGMYLQHILNLDSKYEPSKDPLEEKRKKLKLDGITIKDINLISAFDKTYENSEIIKSLKINKTDGEFAFPKRILDKNEKEDLINLVETLINNCIDNVSDALFDIHPIKAEKRADGCAYCKYSDVCFKKPKDCNYQEVKKESGETEDELN